MALFTDYQIQRLAHYLIEDHGCDLNTDDLLEQIGLILENIAGNHAVSDTDAQNTINRLRSAYYELTRKTRNR